MIDRINLRTVRLLLFAVTVVVLAVLTADRADATDTTTPTECRYNGGHIRPACVDWENVDRDALAADLDGFAAARRAAEAKAEATYLPRILAGEWSAFAKWDTAIVRASHTAAIASANARGAAYCGSVNGTWTPYTAAYDDPTESGGICLLGPPVQATTEAAPAPTAADCAALNEMAEADDMGGCYIYGVGRGASQCGRYRLDGFGWHGGACRHGAMYDAHMEAMKAAM